MDCITYRSRAQIALSLLREHKFRTPFLFLDENTLLASLELFKTSLPRVRLFYATKANGSPDLIKLVTDHGLSLEVASAGEVQKAHDAGIDGGDIYFSTPIKTESALEAIFRYRIARCAVDTTDELERLDAYGRAFNYSHRPEIFVRIRTRSKHVELDLGQKFGCTREEALRILKRSTELNFEVGGLAFHVGTQCTSAEDYAHGLDTSIDIAAEASRRYGVRVPVINIGGGFCDDNAASKVGLNRGEYLRSIGEMCAKAMERGFKIYAEPGRSLVNCSGTLVSSVIGTNVREGQRWVYLDDGIYGCFSIKLYEATRFEFHSVNRILGKISSETSSCTVAGPTCDSLDVVANDVALPNDLGIGEFLKTPNLGAYSVATASTFNGFALPQCCVVRASWNGDRVRTSLLRDQAGKRLHAISARAIADA